MKYAAPGGWMSRNRKVYTVSRWSRKGRARGKMCVDMHGGGAAARLVSDNVIATVRRVYFTACFAWHDRARAITPVSSLKTLRRDICRNLAWLYDSRIRHASHGFVIGYALEHHGYLTPMKGASSDNEIVRTRLLFLHNAIGSKYLN